MKLGIAEDKMIDIWTNDRIDEMIIIRLDWSSDETRKAGIKETFIFLQNRIQGCIYDRQAFCT